MRGSVTWPSPIRSTRPTAGGRGVHLGRQGARAGLCPVRQRSGMPADHEALRLSPSGGVLMDLFPIWLSLQVSVTATALTLLAGVPVAWLLARRRFPGRERLGARGGRPAVPPPPGA